MTSLPRCDRVALRTREVTRRFRGVSLCSFVRGLILSEKMRKTRLQIPYRVFSAHSFALQRQQNPTVRSLCCDKSIWVFRVSENQRYNKLIDGQAGSAVTQDGMVMSKCHRPRALHRQRARRHLHRLSKTLRAQRRSRSQHHKRKVNRLTFGSVCWSRTAGASASNKSYKLGLSARQRPERRQLPRFRAADTSDSTMALRRGL